MSLVIFLLKLYNYFHIKTFYSESEYRRPIHIVAADSSTSDSMMHDMKDHHENLREERVSVIVKDEYISNAAHHNIGKC